MSSNVEVIRVGGDESGRERFQQVGDLVYAGDAVQREAARRAVAAGLARERFRGRRSLWVALRGGAPVARVAALMPTAGSDGDWGMLGFFEAEDDPEAVSALLVGATAWLRDQGLARAVGPMDGDTWHRYRWNLGPYDIPPFRGEPVNPPYYPQLWTDAGFRVLSRYLSKRVDDIAGVVEALRPVHVRTCRNGYGYRSIRLDSLEQELGTLYRLSLPVFRDNLLFTPISEAEFRALYGNPGDSLDPGLVHFALDRDGNDAGFVFAFWSGGTGGAPRVVNLKTLGVLPGHRGRGVASALMYLAYRHGLEHGADGAALCLVREGNPSGRIDAGLGSVFRQYALYEAPPP